MAKKEKTRLEKAREGLRAAQEAYDKLVNHDVGVLTDEQKTKRDQACRDALAAKQKAAEKVRCLEMGKPVPKTEPESKDE